MLFILLFKFHVLLNSTELRGNNSDCNFTFLLYLSMLIELICFKNLGARDIS